ncbi:transposase family protein [Nonomuraea sp. NPDC049028]|uniref:transposase family protein n=1 Tax=Nonomuraea sp. NPDC049028 TaxID=3364348 RepID=UPI00371051AD
MSTGRSVMIGFDQELDRQRSGRGVHCAACRVPGRAKLACRFSSPPDRAGRRGTIDRGGYVLIKARTRGTPISCPGCGQPSTRLHGHYRRLLQDLPAGGRQVLIDLTVRRLKCGNLACKIRTFAEPINGLADRHARNTRLLQHMLERLALALIGRAASRLLSMLGVIVSPDTMIRLIRALPDPEFAQVTVLGVDAWAKRRLKA